MLFFVIFGAVLVSFIAALVIYHNFEIVEKRTWVPDDTDPEILSWRDDHCGERGHYKIRKKIRRRQNDGEEVDYVLMGIPLGIAIIALLAMTPVSLIEKTGALTIEKQRMQYEAQIEELQLRSKTIQDTLEGKYVIQYNTAGGNDILIHMDEVGSTATYIADYNKAVLELKTDIYNEKLHLESPWFNWFTCEGFTKIEGYNPDATSYKLVLTNLDNYVYQD